MNSEGSQVTEFNDRLLFSLTQLSIAFGPARETIGKRIRAAGIRPQGKRGGHDVYHIGMAGRAILDAEKPTYEKITDPDALHPKDRLDWYKGQNEKIKFEREVQQVIPREDVSKEFAHVVKSCVRTIETLPDILEMKCNLAPDVLEVIELECDNARDELSRHLEDE